MTQEPENGRNGEAPKRDGRSGSDWTGPDLGRRWDVGSLLWSLIVPPRGYRTMPTISGWVLVLLSFSLGMAAYNTAGNILFITLSLLLASFIMSGVLAWVNFRRNRWRLTTAAQFRAGETSTCRLELANDKRFVPTYALNFDLRLRNQKMDTTVSMNTRLDAGESVEIPVVITPVRRGVDVLELQRVSSIYPFGFLMKMLPGNVERVVWIWPARIAYQRYAPLKPSALAYTGTVQKAGQGQDLHSLRHYRNGDPMRAIHWKATARARRLLVRQFSADASTGCRLRLDPTAELWSEPGQFERLCSFAATLAEDLFLEGRLTAASIGADGWHPVRRLSELEAVLDRIAALQPVPAVARPPSRHESNLLTFQPGSGRRVQALLDGELAATA